MSLNLAISILVGACTLVAIATYIKNIKSGKNLPYLWAWLIRSILCALLFAAQLSEGATYSLALYGAQLVGGIAIVGMIVKLQGKWGKLDAIDWFAVIMAAIGVTAWAISGNALYSILGVILADLVATSIGIRAAIRYERRESMLFWGLAFSAATLTLFTITEVTWVLMLPPVFSMLNAAANIQVSWWLGHRKRKAQPVPVKA